MDHQRGAKSTAGSRYWKVYKISFSLPRPGGLLMKLGHYEDLGAPLGLQTITHMYLKYMNKTNKFGVVFLNQSQLRVT
jgi:hypothetical protein